MLSFTKTTDYQSDKGGFVDYFKLPGDCKIIKKIAFSFEINIVSVYNNTLATSGQTILSNFIDKYKKGTVFAKASLLINNANDNVILDFPVYVNVASKINQSGNYAARIYSKVNKYIDVLADYKMSSLCKLVFKEANFFSEIKNIKVFQTNFSLIKLFSYIPPNFRIITSIEYEQ